MRGFLSLFCVAVAIASPCTDACIAQASSVEPTTLVCGNDGNTYNVSRTSVRGSDGMKNEHCFAYCGVSVLHVGPCGCPNFCGEALGRGQCVGGSSCSCEAGWAGRDCMTVSCPVNKCSGNGYCQASDDGGADYCVCFAGFTGPFCDTPEAPFQTPIWCGVVPGSPPEYAQDPYGDSHPVMNLSGMVEQLRSLCFTFYEQHCP